MGSRLETEIVLNERKWSRRRGSNPHGTKYHWILSPARLPVPPLRAFASSFLETLLYRENTGSVLRPKVLPFASLDLAVLNIVSKLAGSFLEALSRLFAQNVRIYAYPMAWKDLNESAHSLSDKDWEWSETNGWVSANQRLRPPAGYLVNYILAGNFLASTQIPAARRNCSAGLCRGLCGCRRFSASPASSSSLRALCSSLCALCVKRVFLYSPLLD